MGWLIRTLLIWLLVLAVPAQGAAAATMAFCGPDHHGGGAALQMQPAAGPAVHTHHGDAAATDHEHPRAAVSAEQDTSASAASAASSEVSDASQHKCSACAACCSVAAFLNAVLSVPARVSAPTVFAAVVPSVDLFAADGPDRPPRIALA